MLSNEFDVVVLSSQDLLSLDGDYPSRYSNLISKFNLTIGSDLLDASKLPSLVIKDDNDKEYLSGVYIMGDIYDSVDYFGDVRADIDALQLLPITSYATVRADDILIYGPNQIYVTLPKAKLNDLKNDTLTKLIPVNTLSQNSLEQYGWPICTSNECYVVNTNLYQLRDTKFDLEKYTAMPPYDGYSYIKMTIPAILYNSLRIHINNVIAITSTVNKYKTWIPEAMLDAVLAADITNISNPQMRKVAYNIQSYYNKYNTTIPNIRPILKKLLVSIVDREWTAVNLQDLFREFLPEYENNNTREDKFINVIFIGISDRIEIEYLDINIIFKQDINNILDSILRKEPTWQKS